MLRTATLALVHSTAEYCALAWCRSAHTHLIDPVINDALRIVAGCLRPTPRDLFLSLRHFVHSSRDSIKTRCNGIHWPAFSDIMAKLIDLNFVAIKTKIRSVTEK